MFYPIGFFFPLRTLANPRKKSWDGGDADRLRLWRAFALSLGAVMRKAGAWFFSEEPQILPRGSGVALVTFVQRVPLWGAFGW